MGTYAPGEPWTARDQMLLRTAQVMHAYAHGEFDQIHPVPVDFAVAGTFPENRVIASAPFRRAVYGSGGDGSYVHNSGLFLATGRFGLALTAGAALGRAIGNSRRRADAQRMAQADWRPFDQGAVFVNQYGFYLRTAAGLLWWGWDDLLECQMVEPGRLAMLGVTPEGQRNFMLDSDLAELLFATWALVRQPQHWQFLQRVWLIPAWLEHYRSVYGASAFDFAREFPDHFGQLS
ncbi:hypothetical protein ACFFIO_11060 [Citricoccus parietis]|uniref:Uncharacterized protein n=2 Tax=Citricoccus parietis TaxID=592307 RepID=A0ABV5G1H5_9MICC